MKVGKPKDADGAKNGTKLARGANFKCLMSGAPMAPQYIKGEGKAGRMGARLMAIVAEGVRGRVYLAPTPEMEAIASQAKPEWKPEVTISGSTQYLGVKPYGMDRFDQLFTDRQLVALTTFSDLVGEARVRVRRDALAAGLPADPKPLNDGGLGATADAVAVYLAFGVDRLANRSATICIWNRIGEKVEQVFVRQAIPMTWDFPEANALSDSTGGWAGSLEWVPKAIEALPPSGAGEATQRDAGVQSSSRDKLVSTDPPYYDNIGYADLSDFFYVWLRRSLKPIFPDLFATLAVPKAEELVATPYRHGSKEKAEVFFLDGMRLAMHRLAEQAHPGFPVTIYYAFKQSESDGDDGTTNTGWDTTGWDTFLAAVIKAGFSISGTWPMRTENESRMTGQGTNALASSIVLVCRARAANAPIATRGDFITALKAELPSALRHLQGLSTPLFLGARASGPQKEEEEAGKMPAHPGTATGIAPVDLAQAAIGPGMAIFTRYKKVLDAGGKTLSVRQALALINLTLDEALAEQEGDFDADSRWALAWFEQFGFEEGEFGVAETLSKSKNTSVSGLVEAGILKSSRGKVRLLKPGELPGNWDPSKDTRLSAWEVVHHLARVVEGKGESAGAEILKALGGKADTARELAYRLYSLCERKKWAGEALSYNGLVICWPELIKLSIVPAATESKQGTLDF